MSIRVKELGYDSTPLGELTLRWYLEPRLENREVYEVKLGAEYLMSSLFTESERQLATLGLGPLTGDLDIVIGGLGLGYTAAEALQNENVKSLMVIELFQPVIDWHTRSLVPNGELLSSDPRCRMIQGDFFELARSGFDANDPNRKFDAVLLDIDHSHEHHLDPGNRSIYSDEGLAELREQIVARGVFAFWSNDPVSNEFTERLESIFGHATGHNIEFPNPYTGMNSVNSVYVAQRND